jgi:Icc protein
MARSRLILTVLLGLTLAALFGAPQAGSFRFVIIGDRTGEAQQGVFEEVWHEAAAERPAFVISVGDSIQGLKDESAEREWEAVQRILRPYRRIPLYLAPGNHDVWSGASEDLYRKYSGRPLHYGFDYRQAHFTVLDNSRSDALPDAEMKFLETDLKQNAGQPVKFIVSHRPSWLLQAALGMTQFPLHQAAKRYGARFVVAGHVHQLLHVDLDGVTYLSMPSAGGHLRLSKKYEDGWFFGYAVAEVRGERVEIRIHELKAPYGEGRVTALEDWGKTGLAARSAASGR